MEREATNRHVFLRMVGRLKSRATGSMEASLSLISTSLRCSRKRSPNLQPVSPMYIFTGNTVDEIDGNTREMISDGNSLLRSGNFVRIRDERTCSTSYAGTFDH